MKQILHIFRKDLRHHWIEVFLCQVALVFFCWHEIKSWQSPGFELAVGIRSIGFWAGALLPLSWGLLIFRVVQGESLVGDREFWITRPYEWKKLLCAKALFVLVFITLPLLIAQVVLLLKAGFSPAGHLLGLVWMQLLLIQLPLMPFVAMAAVTRNLTQGLLSIAIVLAYIAGMAFLGSKLDEGAFSSADSADWLAGAILILAVVSALWVQYSQRRTWLARACLAGAAIALTLTELAGSFFAYGEHDYSRQAPGQQLSLRAVLGTNQSKSKKKPVEKDETVDIDIPVVLWNLPPDSFASIRGTLVTFEAPDGSYWRSGWGRDYTLLYPGENRWTQRFGLKYSMYERMKDLPLKARVTLAVDVFRDQDVRQITPTQGEFAIPDVGRCRIDDKNRTGLDCHSPLVRPGLVVARADAATSTCPVDDNDDDDSKQGSRAEGLVYSWEWGSGSELPDYSVSPIESFTFTFNRPRRALICPGTPLIFSFPRLAKRTLVEFEGTGVKLDDYRPEPFVFKSLILGAGRR